ncbi:hypothetical protein ABMY26_32195 [Azospirillum sp. HJ39]|uniref:VpaChn25_0724 family phage protein n=1 Tax=Azospirillum sp. HJ39 TaxID=3159496 RepID=UPI0035585F73
MDNNNTLPDPVDVDPMIEWRRHLRLNLLRTLTKVPGYTSPETVLADVARLYGFAASGAVVREELDWLGSAGLIVVSPVPNWHLVVMLTDAGEDVAEGRTRVDGVARGRP